MIINKVASGLGEQEVLHLRMRYGKNTFHSEYTRKLPTVLLDIVKEPMFILLLLSSLIYFISGEITEGITMLSAMLIVCSISVYQEAKSSRALEALRQYTSPKVVVIRNASEQVINTEDLVPGDILLLKEGDLIPADAEIAEASDLTVNESVLTGESIPVSKDVGMLFQGTMINAGKCIAVVKATGNSTHLGQLGKIISKPHIKKTRLQLQMEVSVKRLATFGIGAFIVICILSFIKSGDLTGSILVGLTLAMSAIPEEIPVAFSSFMALGAYYMAGKGIITRQPQTIENLGAVTTLCFDKTGTITENRMKVVSVDGRTLYYAALASERHPFDNMEKAILEAYNPDDPEGNLLPEIDHEYPLEGKPQMMTHASGLMVAAKGAPERIIAVCKFDEATKKRIEQEVGEMAKKGYRVLGVASAEHNGPFPEKQDDFDWHFEGLLALYDPPRTTAASTIAKLYLAGINVKLITGDYPETAVNIAKITGFTDCHQYITGDQVMKMTDTDLRNNVKEISVFARMYPEAKLRVIESLKTGGEIVAMTGDGINDGLALKAAHIGISMGKKGTDTARLASDLVITNDDLEKIPEAIGEGRKIYNNLKKAIRYIISIHIPIILVATLPLLLNWKYPVIFFPVHIIFLELIMGPTCSLFFQKEPAEANLLLLPPRKDGNNLFKRNELLISIVQGLIITAGLLILYNVYMENHSIAVTRTVVFTTLLVSNIFLTFTNRSFTESITKTIRYKNVLAPVLLFISLLFVVMILLIPGVRNLFGLAAITFFDFLMCLLTGFICVAWFEVYKMNFINAAIYA